MKKSKESAEIIAVAMDGYIEGSLKLEDVFLFVGKAGIHEWKPAVVRLFMAEYKKRFPGDKHYKKVFISLIRHHTL